MMSLSRRVSWVAVSVLAIVVAGCCDSDIPLGVREGASVGPAAVAFGSSGSFGVIAADTVTNTGTTTITGDLGVSPGTVVLGSPTVSGTIQAGNATSAAAQTAVTAAVNDILSRTGAIVVSGDLAGRTISPGIYSSTSSLVNSGTVTLNALGHPDAYFIITTATGLTTAANSQIELTGGAQASHVIWLVGTSANLGANSDFKGTILSNGDITLGTGATLAGRAIARPPNGTVVLDSNTIVAQ